MADQRKRGGMKQGTGKRAEAKAHQNERPEISGNNKTGGKKAGQARGRRKS